MNNLSSYFGLVDARISASEYLVYMVHQMLQLILSLPILIYFSQNLLQDCALSDEEVKLNFTNRIFLFVKFDSQIKIRNE